MSADPHDSASFAALADDASRDAAMARALGVPVAYVGRKWCRVDVSGTYIMGKCPAYFTGGDLDPFANWGLLAEVMRLMALDLMRDGFTEGNALIEALYCTTGQHLLPTPGKSLHRAACLAAVAAGLVPKGGE
ncbi:MAG TPA: hypothetical protein VNE39_28840 [Planctomycetota bacterium]|nr:hypothetical protein [Planctomycetota bacterium]